MIRCLSCAAGWLACAVCLWSLVGCAKPVAKVAEPAKLPSDDELRDRIDRAVEFTYSNRHLDSKDQAAWQVVHGALAFGRPFQIYHDGKLVSAIDYLFAGGSLRGWNLRPGDHGLEAVLEAGSNTGQGHEDQWLGYLSQCGLSPDEKIVVADKTYTVHDLITQAQWDIYDGMEATWTLMAFSTYLPQDAEWTAKDGTKWNIPRIVGMEAKQKLDDSACGGTHRMYALAVALNRYLESGGKISDDPNDPWFQAKQKIDDAVATVRSYQQPDGSFSTNYFLAAGHLGRHLAAHQHHGSCPGIPDRGAAGRGAAEALGHAGGCALARFAGADAKIRPGVRRVVPRGARARAIPHAPFWARQAAGARRTGGERSRGQVIL